MHVGPWGASVCLTDPFRMSLASARVTSLHGLLLALAAVRFAAAAIAPDVALCRLSWVTGCSSGSPTGLSGLRDVAVTFGVPATTLATLGLGLNPLARLTSWSLRAARSALVRVSDAPAAEPVAAAPPCAPPSDSWTPPAPTVGGTGPLPAGPPPLLEPPQPATSAAAVLSAV